MTTPAGACTRGRAQEALDEAPDATARGAPAVARPPRALTRASGSLATSLLAATLLSGCQAVDFTERRRLADPIMQLDDGPTQTHLDQKVYYSREGSAGGIGASAGGGCGCY